MKRTLLPLVLPVLLTACAGPGADQAVVVHEGGTVRWETWGPGVHEVRGTVLVADGILTLAPCATVRMAAGASLEVGEGGALQAAGTPDCRITLTSAAARPLPGDWEGLRFTSGSLRGGSALSQVDIAFAGGDGRGAVWVGPDAELSMQLTTVTASANAGLEVAAGGRLGIVRDCRLINNTGAGARVDPDAAGGLRGGVYGPNGEPGVEVTAGAVLRSQQWSALDEPFVAPEGFDVVAGARLRLVAGVRVQLGSGASVDVREGASLWALGQPGLPVRWSTVGDRVDAPGWGAVHLRGEPDSLPHRLFDVAFDAGGVGVDGAVQLHEGAAALIDGLTVRGSVSHGLVVGLVRLEQAERLVVQDNALEGLRAHPDVVGDLGAGSFGPNGRPGLLVDSGNVLRSTLWPHRDEPYVAPLGFSVRGEPEVARLVLTSGVELVLGPDAVLAVARQGALALHGLPEARVVITSAEQRVDEGRWGEIAIYADSEGSLNRFRHADIQFGGSLGRGQVRLEAGAGLELDDVAFAAGECDVSGAATITLRSSAYVPCD